MIKIKTNKIKKACAFPIMALVTASSVMAINWTGNAGDSDWFNSDNWEGGGDPSGQNVNFPNGGSAVISGQETSVAAVYHYKDGTITVQGSGENAGKLTVTGAGDMFAIGNSDPDNPTTLILKDKATFSWMYSSGNAQMRIGFNGAGKLVLEAGSTLEMYYTTSSSYDKRGLLIIGSNSLGDADISGTIKVTNIKVGLSTQSNGTMTINEGASVTAGYLLQVGGMGGTDDTNKAAVGTLNINGGTVTVAEFGIGVHGRDGGTGGNSGTTVGEGTVNMSGGTVTANRTYVGERGKGEFNLSGGNINFGALTVGYGTSGSKLQNEFIDPEGTLNISGGTATASSIYIGRAASTSGTINISDGSLSSTSGTVYIGYSGKGEIYISGDGKFAANALNLGYNAGGTGLLEIQRATGSLYRTDGTTLTTITGRNGSGIVRFNYAGSMTFANVMSGNNIRVEHVNSGVTTLSGASSYGGGTLLSNGTIIAANNTALGSGKLEIKGGTLKTNVNALSIGSIEMTSGSMNLIDGLITQTSLSGNFSMTGGTLAIDIESLSSFDQVLSVGGMALLDGGILNVNGYEGFEGVVGQEGYRYKIFDGFSPIADHSLSITGYDKSNWVADIDSEGYLFFVAIPEAGTYAIVFGALALAFAAYRKRR